MSKAGSRIDAADRVAFGRRVKPVVLSADRIVDIVRDHIHTGRLAAGAPIRQDVLAGELGISKIPVREALGRIQQDGLIYTIPNRGFFVRPLTRAEAYEVYDLRLAIEPAAAARGAMTANEADRRAAIRNLAALSKAISRQLSDIGSLHRAFHKALVASAGRDLTGQIIERLHIVSERYVRHHLAASGRIQRANAEHADILDAWLGRDAPLVEKLMSGHIQATLDDLRHEIEPDFRQPGGNGEPLASIERISHGSSRLARRASSITEPSTS
ncbi:GntR family transcriptional regulator [Acidiphilium sp. AL]|uniref:GntR family transcriptional regulator n=1 Tax=Acidiphilium iwatense TaxID=768198 RepID=A0ABS9E0X0_9PROT|nr:MULTISPECIES: GntR family transcriptional regulator [Acidiphilium]MCF3948645.1 GntR family transcriptional regulator [Acidiphilium iwatense]MCU4161769.1 GntR family transcriptional regulator [Acidiphilium sp. AL]